MINYVVVMVLAVSLYVASRIVEAQDLRTKLRESRKVADQ